MTSAHLCFVFAATSEQYGKIGKTGTHRKDNYNDMYIIIH